MLNVHRGGGKIASWLYIGFEIKGMRFDDERRHQAIIALGPEEAIYWLAATI
jgi:hypothetical protein